jgi:hypothetical protein
LREYGNDPEKTKLENGITTLMPMHNAQTPRQKHETTKRLQILQTWPAMSHNCSLMLLGRKGGGVEEGLGMWM